MYKQKDSAHAAQNALDGLRRGEHIAFENMLVSAAEFASDAQATQLLITGARAQSLGLATDAQGVLIDISSLSIHQIHALANPTLNEAPTITAFKDAPEFTSLLTLAKRAGLLPALLISDAAPHEENLTQEMLLEAINAPITIFETARAKLPLDGAENSTLASFREQGSDAVHLALIIGNIGANAPLTRVHSSCVTGDLLGSLRCDCGDQLSLALAAIKAAGQGVLLYLNQEGRGIGITNKLRAYALQERGIDTYAANVMLGFGEDERDFSAAAAMLKSLNISAIQLLSNNPHKVSALETAGIKVEKRVPLIAKSGKHNHDYIIAKSTKAGHIF